MEVIKENYKLYQGDCLELLKNIPNKSINLVLIDPPYNIGKDKWDKWDTVEDYVEFMGKVFLEIQRVLKDNGSFYFFHNDFMQIVELQNFINKNTDFIFRQLITWNKIHEDFKNYGYVQQRLSVDMMRNYYNGFTEYCLYYTFHDETGLSKVMTRDNFSKVSEKIREYVEGNFNRDYIVDLFLKEGRYSTIGSARVHASYKMGWNKGKRFDLMDEKLFDYLNNYLHFPFKYEELRQEYEELRQEYEELRQEYEELRYTFNTATVKKDLLGNVKITVQENNAMLYSYIDNILYIVDEDGVMEKDTKQEKLSYVQRYPQAINFDEKHLKQFIKEYKQLPSVIKNQISSIVFEPNDKDQTKCKLELDDGKIFYVRIEDMVRQLTSTNYYLVTQKYPENKYYDFLGKNVYVYN